MLSLKDLRETGSLNEQVQGPGSTRGARSSANVGLTQLDAIKEERSALISQLTSLTIRRDLLTQQLRNASGESVAELQAQIRQLDAKVKQNAADQDRIDVAIHNAVTGGVAGTASGGVGSGIGIGSGGPDIASIIQGAISSAIPVTGSSTETRMDHLERGLVYLGAVNGLGIVLTLVLLWRSLRPPRLAPSRLAGEDAARLDHLQGAVDVIALEVERISESQRFVAKAVNSSRAIQPDVRP